MKYPYLPKGHTLQTIDDSNEFMFEAKKARYILAGDSLFPIGTVIVKDDCVVASAGNGYSLGSGKKHICPRIVENCASGEGYELCSFHDPDGHAEAMVIKKAKDNGIELNGSDLYLYGHWWCCKPCWDKMIDVGIRHVYVLEDAQNLFSREVVYSETLKPTGDAINFKVCDVNEGINIAIKNICKKRGIETLDNPNVQFILLSKKDVKPSKDLLQTDNLVYHIVYKTEEEAVVKFKNLLKML